jgi:predicted nucleic acid-binding protein
MTTGGDAYLDTSVVVNLLLNEPFSARAEAFAKLNRDALVVTDFAAAEFSSAMARRVRMDETSKDEARAHLADLDEWIARSVLRMEITPADIARADSYMRRLDLALRTPDAIHIATARRLEARLATFDRRMADAARTLGVSIAEI